MSDKPDADKPWHPYHGHRTMAEVIQDEETQRGKRRKYHRDSHKGIKR